MQYRDQTLYIEEMPLADIARREGTPSYVYSRAAILDRFQAYDRAFGDVPHKVCYAVKANSNLSILKLLAGEGSGGGATHKDSWKRPASGCATRSIS